MYIQANIGRNVEVPAWQRAPKPGVPHVNPNHKLVEPMEADRWHAFRQDTREALFLSVHDVDIAVAMDIEWEDIQVHTGTGEWGGVKEESAHVSVYFDTKPGQVNAARLHEHLADRLVELAGKYGQDAIAFVVTDSHLATR